MLVALLFVAFAIFIASLPRAEAIAGPSICSYYSDAKYKTVVGGRGVGCCGEVISWGVTTPYVKCQRLLCTQSLCPN